MTDKYSIESLPDEVLLHIFELLDGHTLINCLSTFKRWNNLIGNSSQIMKKFEFKLVLDNVNSPHMENFENVFVTNRKIYSLYIRQMCEDESNLVKTFLEQHGANIRCFKYSYANSGNLQELLNLMPLLETLDLVNVKLTVKKEETPINLRRLKNLKLHNCSIEIFNLIDSKDKLLNLDVAGFPKHEMIADFLGEHQHLEQLKVGNDLMPDLFKNPNICNTKCRLKKLTLLGNFLSVVTLEDNFKDFLKLHRKSLQQIKLDTLIGPEFYQFVLTNYKHLKYITLHVDTLPTEKSFYCCIGPLTTVKRLRLYGRFPKHEVAKLFMNNFPSLEHLDMRLLSTCLWFSKFLKTISIQQKNLQHLLIPNFFKGTPKNLQFPQLTNLHVRSIDKHGYWKNFVLSHRTLESISTKRIPDENVFTSQFIENIMEMPCLESIILCGDLNSLKKIFDEVKKDYKGLRLLDYSVGSSPLILKRLKIYFPFDKNYWNPESYEECIKYLENSSNL